MIPKIIHQIWIGTQPKPEKWMQTWKDMHPDWEYMEWNDVTVEHFGLVNKHHYEAADSWNGKSNFVKAEVLYRYGGIYVDADMECVRPFDLSLLDNDCFACYENEDFKPGLIATGVIGATKGNKLMELCIKRMGERQEFYNTPSWIWVGPQFFTDVVKEHKYDKLKVYPSHYFLPDHYSGAKYSGDGPVYCRHHWHSTHNRTMVPYDNFMEKQVILR